MCDNFGHQTVELFKMFGVICDCKTMPFRVSLARPFSGFPPARLPPVSRPKPNQQFAFCLTARRTYASRNV